MTALLDALANPVWQHLAFALLHTLWQGLLVATILWLILLRLPANHPNARYWTAFAALFVLLLGGLTTWSILNIHAVQSTAAPSAASTASIGERPETPTPDAPAVADAVASTPPTREFGPSDDADKSARVAARSPAGGTPAPSAVWPTWIMAGWLLGMTFMMVRMLWTVLQLRRWTRGPAVADDRIWLWTNEIRHLLHITRTLRIVETAEEYGPAVLGVVRPVLALPVSLLTGLPPDAVRAVLAHELAHIRRHDYLLNLVQMAIETLLYFNPAAWWISRQVRIEREACCDALAARVLGQPYLMAEALSLWAEHLYARRPAAQARARLAAATTGVSAFAGEGRRRPRLLLDRVRRILSPGYRPPMPLSPAGLLGLLVGSVVILGALSCGTSAVVDAVAKALSPAERMERIVAVQNEYAPPTDADAKGKITLKGAIRTSDGRPVPEKVSAVMMNGPGCSTLNNPSPTFTYQTRVGRTWLQFRADGYAPAIVGPFTGKAGETISNIDVCLGVGFPLTIYVVDEHGKPVVDAEVSAYPSIDGRSMWPSNDVHKTNAAGVATIPHAVEYEYRINAKRPGFQPQSLPSQLVKANQAITLTLAHAQPLSGVVRTAEGKPVAGAEIRELAWRRPDGGVTYGATGPLLAATDAQGRFTLTQLVDNTTYWLGIVAQGYGRQLLRDVHAGQREKIDVRLGPELTVAGHIRGDLDELQKDTGKPVVQVSQSIRLAFNSESCFGCPPVAYKVVDGKGQFMLHDLWPGSVFVAMAKHMAETSVSETTPHQEVTLDLSQPVSTVQKRRVVMRFVAPDGGVCQAGAVQIRQLSAVPPNPWNVFNVAIVQGAARFEAEASGAIYYQPHGLLGYWFPEGRLKIEPGTQPLEITVPVVPAGAVAGQVLNADGAPANDRVSLSVQGVFRQGNNTQSGGFGNNIEPDAQGRFFIGSVPLGGDYVVTATRGYTIQASPPLKPDAANPTLNVTLRFPRTADVSGRVVDAHGQPIRIPFELSFSGPMLPGRHSWGNLWSGNLSSGYDGKFHIDNLSVGVGQYAVIFKPTRDYQPQRVPLSLDGRPITVTLRPGLTLAGQLVDAATGEPLPQQSLRAYTERSKPEGDFWTTDTLTDEQGQFRFTNLVNCPYSINPPAGRRWSDAGAHTYTPGATDLILRAEPTNQPLQ